MIRRLFALVIASVLLAGTQAGVAAAQSSGSQDIIKNGLWAGSNFNVSSRASTNTQTPLPPPVSNPNAYAALGDSVAAGYGLPYGPNATAADKRCGRSASAYAYEVAAAKNMTLTHAACSGAKAGDLFTKQGVQGPNIAPQLKKAFSGGVPGLISITAGANDIHWRAFLQKCYASTCGSSFDTTISDSYLAFLELKLHYMFYEISVRSGGAPPPVIITGYYNPLSANCSTLQPRFTASEITWLSSRLNSLNTTLQSVSAQYPFATFVPIDFTGHDICSATPWVQGPSDTAPFHPTASGQQVIARSVLDNL